MKVLWAARPPLCGALPLQAGKLPMSPGKPKLRDDLVISQQETKEGTGFVVKDPTNGRFFRLKEVTQIHAERR
jgi:hypothetical protein